MWNNRASAAGGSSSAGGGGGEERMAGGGGEDRWVQNLQDELNGAVGDEEEIDDEKDQCELSSCAPRLLTAGGYNRHHYEGEVRMHVRASLYA